MKIQNYIFLVLSLIVILGACQSKTRISQGSFDKIVTGFVTPADSNNLWVYWYWMNDDISKDGITRDLEAMKKAGIGGVFIGNINDVGKDGNVPVLSEEWWSLMVHAVVEAKRIGVEVGIFNCPGWSQSGGPWIDYKKAMRYLTYNETKVSGGKQVSVQLAQPTKIFQDVHTLAFKSTEIEGRNLQSTPTTISSNIQGLKLKNMIDGSLDTDISYPASQTGETTFEFSLNEEIKARQISISPSLPFTCNGQLFAEINGEEKLLRSFRFDRWNFGPGVGPIIKGALVLSLPDVVAKKFKVVLKDYYAPRSKDIGIAEINISETPIIEKYIEKQLGKMFPSPDPVWDSYFFETQESKSGEEYYIATESVIDVSDKMDENGVLNWNAPAGEWTIMRIGMAPTGASNGPSAPQGRGLEIDKMSAEIAQFHFEHFVGEFLKRIPEESKSAFKYVIADSYEQGSQNWTDGYEVKFKEKYGYDPVKYLPVLSGRIVGSAEESERFLWDLRRSIADDVAYEYVGGLRKASNENNLKTWLENYGHWGFPSEFMTYGGQSDLIGGEFWHQGTLGGIECKGASSTAHAYGKPITYAEAFTSSFDSYLRHPAKLKKRGDWCFTTGVNHFVLHVYIQQAEENRKPGRNAWFGTEFNRHNTWFSQANNYFDYLRRCQHMLQQGKYAADVCYFIGEFAPLMTGARNPEIPDGYSYDYINAEVILERLSVKDGRFVLPDGISYRAMVLPPIKTMRPKVLAKIEELVKQGGIIIGQKPEKSPSLQDYPQCDANVKNIADKLWDENYSAGKFKKEYGKGLVLNGYDLKEVFEMLNVTKDFDVAENTPVLWTHRTLPGMDIYFITNQSDNEIEIKPTFRVNSTLKPQLWDAVTGEIRFLSDYGVNDSGTQISLKLKAEQSWFVVFTNGSSETVKKAYNQNNPEPEILKTVEQPFTVDFENKQIGPVDPLAFDTLFDWAKSENEQIKYYSGTATYRSKFTVDKLPENAELFINLGQVAVMAEVSLNGKKLGGVWMAPYRVNATGVMTQGENQLEIKVVNLWRNRLLKDPKLPADQRYTWIVDDYIKEDEALHPSGLLGPVTIEEIKY